MTPYVHPHSKKAGMPPGMFIHVGVKRTEGTILELFSYDSGTVREHSSADADEIISLVNPAAVNWINVSGLSQTETVGRLCEHFGVHPLTIEDILNTGQRPKIEDHEGYLFASLKMLYPDESGGKILYEQVSLILSDHLVITFQEEAKNDVFDQLRERIRTAKGRIRGQGPDYLAYSIIDAVVDQYYVVLERIGERIEAVEELLVQNPTRETLGDIHSLKNEMLLLRRFIWPLREVIAFLERAETDLITDGMMIYFRDVYDHTIQVIDTTELYRDIISGMLDTYLSSLSNRMNEVMKVLTVFASIFIPLTFIVGIYGMNFDYMPELRWHWGYPALWVVMLAVVVSMFVYFRKKRWI
jgi:magnesium transporter